MSGFSEVKQKAISFYESKSGSEQKMLLVLAVSIVLFVLFSFYSSVANGLADSEQKLAKQRELNVWADSQIAIIKANKGRSGSVQTNQGSMTQQVNSTARRYKVTVSRIQPQNDDAVKLGLEPISFNKLVSFLSELEKRYAIRVANIDISETDVSGEVKVRRLDLER